MGAAIHEGHGPLSEAEVQAAERALGVQFPPDYRAFLRQWNGGYPEPDAFRIQWAPGQPGGDEWRSTLMSWFYAVAVDSASSLVELNQVSFRGRLPAGTLAFASDAGGNQLLLALDGPHRGKVLFWVKDHEAGDDETPGYDNVGIVADSFTDFLQNRLY